MVPFNPTFALTVFLAYFLVDALYAYYTFSVTRTRPLRAAASGSLVYVLLAVGVIGYTRNAWYLVPMVLGSFLGTYLIVERKRRLIRDREAS